MSAATNNKGAWRFHFFPIVTIATVVGVFILLALGTWQVQRRAWKLNLIDAVATRSTGTPRSVKALMTTRNKGNDIRYSAVQITGEYDHAHEAHVFGTLGPTPGYYIFTPLISAEVPEGALVYINRGFVSQDNKAAATRQDGQVLGPVSITGLFREVEKVRGMAKYFPLTPQPAENIWYQRIPTQFSKYSFDDDGVKTVEWYIDSSGTENAALYPRGNTTKIDFNNRHLEYALTWYGLALTLIGVWFAYSWRRGFKSA